MRNYHPYDFHHATTPMTSRTERKQRSRERILDAAAKRLRIEGLAGGGIADVMADAGLTHGAFYAHFAGKEELLCKALAHALAGQRKTWLGRPRQERWSDRLKRLAERYLTPAHRKDLARSCAFAALGSEAARATPAFKAAFEQELLASLAAICQGDFPAEEAQRQEEALAFLSLMVGSIILSRAVSSKELSDRFLHAGQTAVLKLSNEDPDGSTLASRP